MDNDITRKRMQDVVDLLLNDVGTIRAGRANSNFVGQIEIAVYGGSQRLKVNELATITIQDSQNIIISPWDKSIIDEIRVGILKANVGINPVDDGEVIRIVVPPLTSEDREKLIKILAVKIENAKIMVRQVRAEVRKRVKTGFEEKQITEDDKFNLEKEVQDITDELIKKIDEIGEEKKQELIQV